MTLQTTYHVLLIGIDAYSVRPLRGCVTDIDLIQQLLIDRVGIAPAAITRLVSPHPTPARPTVVPSQPATLNNIRDALARLGTDAVGPNDRVFIYFAGHGARLPVEIDGQTRWQEVLVPADFTPKARNVLFDFELNAFLSDITQRTSAATMILDCCHSSGATRSLDDDDATNRVMEVGANSSTTTLNDAQARLARRHHAVDGTGRVDDCHVVAACLSHEVAKETPQFVAPGGTRTGLLTKSLLAALADVPDTELITAPWGRLWNELRATIEADTQTPKQHPWMSGGLARAWLAGPPADGDVGLLVERSGADEYRVGAGALAGITPGACIAVYGQEPHHFPPLGTPEDIAARSTPTLLTVTQAEPGSSLAVPTGEQFELPRGARGRLVRAGDAEQLPCAVLPPDSEITAAIDASHLVTLVEPHQAVARLEQVRGGDWVLTDDVHGARAGDPELVRLPASATPTEVRRALEHYVRYAGPMRMASRCTDLPGALEIELLMCTAERVAQGDIAGLPLLPAAKDGSYALAHEAMFAIRVQNRCQEPLKVALFNSDARGPVGLLGTQPIDAGSAECFWLDNTIGDAFYISVPGGQRECIDRMVAIGTSDMASDLSDMTERWSFEDAVRGAGDRSSASKDQPADRWTATQVIIRTANHAPS